MLKWLNDKLSKGFYFPYMNKAILLLEKASLNYWAKKYVREKIVQSEKTPLWVSELYQFLFLALGFLAFIFSEWIYIEYFSYPIIVIFSYRIFDIFIFILAWITEKEVRLHGYRRSIAGFLLNIVEVAIYFSILAIWSGGLRDSTKLNIFYKYMVGILTLCPPGTECTILSLGELVVSAFLILVVLGALVGALLRGEVGEEKKEQ